MFKRNAKHDFQQLALWGFRRYHGDLYPAFLVLLKFGAQAGGFLGLAVEAVRNLATPWPCER